MIFDSVGLRPDQKIRLQINVLDHDEPAPLARQPSQR
jgi:hypothetical protein